MPVWDAAVLDLRDKCGLPPDKCRAALERERGNVDAALRGLIDAGEVSVTQLDPESVGDAFFARAELHRLTELARKFALEHPTDKETSAMFKVEIAEWKRDKALLGEITRSAQREARQRKRGKRAAKRKALTLKSPPFPPLTADDDQWAGRDALPSWKGFEGGTRVVLNIQRRNADDAGPPVREQVAAYEHLRANEQTVRDAVLTAVLKEYNALRRKRSLDEDVGDILAPSDLKRHLGLTLLHILEHAKGGHAYVGLDLHCAWDEEHGVGVLLHKSRVVAIGQADTSFDRRAAKKDGGKRIGT